MFKFTSKRKFRTYQIAAETGVVTSGRKAGKLITKLIGRRDKVVRGVVDGTAVVFDTRHWRLIEDRYNFHRPRNEDGTPIRPALPVAAGWIVPTS